jgi:hypothetical protein
VSSNIGRRSAEEPDAPTIRPTPNGKRFKVTIRNKLLPKPLNYTFDDLPSAEAYAEQCEKWLAAGIVPTAMIAEPKKTRQLVGPVIRAWINTGEPSKSDVAILDLLFDELGKLERSDLTYRWADQWVRGMKRTRNLAPGTIRKRVGALSEMLAWEIRTSPDLGLPNPLTSLPRGYSTYNEVDAEAARKAGWSPRLTFSATGALPWAKSIKFSQLLLERSGLIGSARLYQMTFPRCGRYSA